MKKTLLLFAVTVAMQFTASAQAVQQGNVLIDAYYGFPDLYKTVLRAGYETTDNTGFKVGGIGPVGIRAEYMLGDKIGLGVDVGFTDANVQFTRTSEYVYSEDGTSLFTGIPVTYEDKAGTRKIGGMVTFNYHFLDSDALDAYAMLGAGYKQRTYYYETTQANYADGAEFKGINPIAFRIGAGMRYFFTDNIGANLAIGFGQGGLVNGGLSFKF